MVSTIIFTFDNGVQQESCAPKQGGRAAVKDRP